MNRLGKSGWGRSLWVIAMSWLGAGFLLASGCGFKGVPPRSADEKKDSDNQRLFAGWTRPDLALVLSAEQHGYLMPCGCSRPQYGGLERRHNFLQELRERGWAVVPIDLGDIPQRQGPRQLQNVQGMIKYRYSMEALNRMGYLAVGLGEYESALSLFNLLGEYALNNPSPKVVAANLRDDDKAFEGAVHPFVATAVQGSRLKVGITSVIGPSVAARVKPYKVELLDNRQVIPGVLKQLAQQKADLLLLLYQGSLREARALAGAHPEFHAILCLSDADEPSSEPVLVGNTIIVSPGHKGRYVGVVGAWATGKADRPYDFRYQLVSLSEDYLTPAEKQGKQPILALMEKYTQELRAENYLARYAPVKHPAQVALPGTTPVYVGSEKCKKCHESAYEVWKNSKHAHAYETLEKATQPALRQHDAECIVCHTVGFGYESGFRGEKVTPHLKDVGCESCHGPASEHVKKATDERWYPILNPWRPGQNETPRQKEERLLRIDNFCQGCHDIDNDVHYKFDKRWPPINHPTPRD